ncbi:MAG: 23S rRNA (adenine(2503)-C(2))-methyltransferase RlmN [Acidobacteria bacterium]|nr:23S rRNA (adenine(2503)-C(2))-methyltransferase RlmN [Acidobacteriota bacterium]
MNPYPWEDFRPHQQTPYIYGYTCDELTQQILTMGYREVHGPTLFGLLHRYGPNLPSWFDGQRLPRGLWHKITSSDKLDPIHRVEAHQSDDGSTKYRFHISGGSVEGIYMPFPGRHTLCISSQIGCAMGCTFCATGTMGLHRHLSAAEMVSQVLNIKQRHPDETGKTKRFNVVFMGMGEPLHNLDQVLKAVSVLTDPAGLNLSPRDVAVSTSGLIPKIEQMATVKKRPQLMVSIAATTDEARSAIMPVNRAYPLEDLMRCLERYPLRKGERVMLSYVLIENVNDTEEDARRLAAMSQRFPSLVNVIPMNEHEGSPGFVEPDESRTNAFANILLAHGVFTTIRRSRGRDVAGACGQLVQKIARKKNARTYV